MLKISHRGNLTGRNPERENEPRYVIEALEKGFQVEIDVWVGEDFIALGHDSAKHRITLSFLCREGLLIHCKNVTAYHYLMDNPDYHLVYHSGDIALTSKGYLFTAPGLPITERSIAVMPELSPLWDFSKAYAVCTDYVMNYL